MKSPTITTTEPTAFPRKFASIGDFAARTPFNKAWLEAVRKKAPSLTILEPNGRVNFEAFLQGISDIGLKNLEIIDGKFEQDRLTRARADEQEAINATREGEIIWAKDRKYALSATEAMDHLLTELLAFKREFLALAKRHGLEPEFRKLLEKFYNQVK